MKVGVVGLGGMGLHHARVLRELPMVSDLLGCDSSAAARAKAGGQGLRGVPILAELIDWRPDAVFVVTPPAAHAPVIEPLLRRRIPVFTEKPLASTLADCRKLVKLSQQHRVPLQVGFELRYCGMTRGMRQIVRSGKIGRPLQMSLVQLSGPHGPGRMVIERTGGVFYEKLCHQVDLYRLWLGEPQRVMAIASPNALRHYTVPDNVVATLVFPGGRLGTIHFLTTRAAQIGGHSDHGDRGHFYELTLTGTKGSVTYCAWTEELSVVRFNHRKKDPKSELVARIKVADRWGEPAYDLATQNTDFLTRVRKGRPLQYPATDALKSMEWVARAERSLASGGKWIAA